MTRRIRFTPWSCARTLVQASVVASCCLGGGVARAGEVPFSTPPPISTATPVVQAMSVADVDGDGDLDALSASFQDDTIAWHENLGLAGWALHTISLTADGAQDVGAADIDRDGDMDVLSTSLIDNRVAWYENTAGNGSAWLTHTITNGAYAAWSVESGDVDGDGDQDVLATAASAGTVAWYENTLGNGSVWVPRTITTDAPMATSVFAADVDGDGDQDALSASQSDDKVAWYENTLGNGSAWVTHTISTGAESARNVVAADVDGDGDRDAITSTGDSLTWFENTAGNGSAWIARTMAPLADPWALATGDIDGDGDIDALTVPLSSLQLVWLENASGNGASWTAHTVATVGYGVFSVALADLDGDGDPDLASAEANDGEINWYRNESIHQTACFVRQPDISTAPGSNTIFLALASADVDGDGDTDGLSFQDDNRLSWHENVAGDGSSWITRTVATSTGRLYSIVPVDTDGDGDVDLVTQPGLVVTRFDNAAGNGTVWNPGTLWAFPPGFSRGILDAADIDRDGNVDILVPDAPSTLSWIENPGSAAPWTPHAIAASPRFWEAQGDIDRDGDLDVITTTYTNVLEWYENVGGTGSSWTPHLIASSGTEGFGPGPVDIDGDGDLDLFVSTGFKSLGWIENIGNGSSWVLRPVGTTADLSRWVDAGDLDGDGDLDGLAMNLGPGVGLYWFENASGNGSVWVPQTAAAQTTDPFAVGRTTDVDSDGDLDILHGRWIQSTVGWSRNEGGQVVFDLLDQVPATVSNDDVFPILRLAVTHGGRAGDSDLELAHLGLLFEEEPGDPLTSAEANALVAELRIYRDADGNGLFDPGIDTLVASVPRLDLTAGVQTVTFPDGDPNVQVAFGTPRTFFVVAQLTADASQQVPHQFRVTHLGLGPSATRAEDRIADIPLTIACPSDVASRLIIAVPVELIDFTIE